ncbi:hypothetical protein [Pseudomonas folii]|uniref:Peptidase M41 domain-containing protein n=1 Tax=Pseudomonas folii TaxID=2762593 RepID=A0ABR7AVL2_9PSED|nr:hypothetical protein [Pseudomonas folii]MBC3948954.1 hypothetical protein [Pseudomonas folii]
MASCVRLKREVVEHEVGHWITARHHGIYTDHIEITRDGNSYYGHCNLFIFPRLREIGDARKLIESRIRTLMAGAAAQLIDRKTAEWSCVMEIFRGNGANDFDKISEYIYFVSGFDSNTFMDKENASELFDNLFAKYWLETVKIISDNTKTIRALSDHILSKLDDSPVRQKFPTEDLVSHLCPK